MSSTRGKEGGKEKTKLTEAMSSTRSFDRASAILAIWLNWFSLTVAFRRELEWKDRVWRGEEGAWHARQEDEVKREDDGDEEEGIDRLRRGP